MEQQNETLKKLGVGRPYEIKTPDELWEKAVDYFKWVEDNPILEEKAFASQGNLIKTDVNKMRAMTIEKLCLHIGICEKTFRNIEADKNRANFLPVITRIRKIIYAQKFEGAAAGMLNANIIARDLGLVDKKQTTQLKLTPEQMAELPDSVLENIMNGITVDIPDIETNS